ncbi:nuclear transport factor 2 family protein [Ralstonia sp. UBA689]|uniref:nuclear transport factor 2 family protein n=1 Tax=Ralstonia sp. UBA689 TaxID=1947373 RepID=UPI0025F3540F|nr:nuclear transport factor 2 family protein [Ralstonia sp. UBA689]
MARARGQRHRGRTRVHASHDRPRGDRALPHRDFSRLFVANVSVQFSGIHADGDTVIVEERMRATLANGRQYDNTYCFVFTLAQGRIAFVREYMDTRRGGGVHFWAGRARIASAGTDTKENGLHMGDRFAKLVRLQEWNSSSISMLNKDFLNSPILPCPQICPQFSGTLWFDCESAYGALNGQARHSRRQLTVGQDFSPPYCTGRTLGSAHGKPAAGSAAHPKRWVSLAG